MRKSSLIAFFLIWLLSEARAHPVHRSTAEAEYNPKTKKLEVSLTVFVNDLEVALIRQCEREMRIDKTPEAEFDDQIKVYLSKSFVARDPSGKSVKLEWVGREWDGQSAKSDEPTVTLYFEFELHGGLDGYCLQDALFFDRFTDQQNLLLLRSGTRKVEMLFSKANSSRKLEFPGQ